MSPVESNLQPRLKAPAGTCDTHMHVYDSKYPTAPTAKFVPPDAPVSAYRNMCKRVGIERTVVVQPSTYGKDNRCTLEAVAEPSVGMPGALSSSTKASPMQNSTD